MTNREKPQGNLRKKREDLKKKVFLDMKLLRMEIHSEYLCSYSKHVQVILNKSVCISLLFQLLCGCPNGLCVVFSLQSIHPIQPDHGLGRKSY